MLENYFDFCFKLLYVNGLHPRKMMKPLTMLNLGMTILTLFLSLVKFVIELNVDQLEGIFILGQILMKEIAIVLTMKKIQAALDDLKQFCNINLEESKLLLKYLPLQKIYTVTLMACLPIFAAKPFIDTDKSIYGCCYPQWLPFIITYPFEVYVTATGILTVVAEDLTLCFLILMATEQFHVFNKKLKDIDLNLVHNSYELNQAIITFKEHVTYHNFLLMYVKKLNGILSVPQFIVMGTSIGILCFCMYNSSINPDSLVLKYRVAFIAISLILEFFVIYGYPAQVMMDEAAEVGNTLYYNCGWYLPNIKPLRKYILMMLMRSQKPAAVSAAGFFIINNATVVLLMRTAYSFYTVLRTVK